jgi:hypothetical protein
VARQLLAGPVRGCIPHRYKNCKCVPASMTSRAVCSFCFVDQPAVCFLARAPYFLVTFSTAAFTANLALAATIEAFLLYNQANLFLAKLIWKK